jgi:hypothetical protein
MQDKARGSLDEAMSLNNIGLVLYIGAVRHSKGDLDGALEYYASTTPER